MDNTKLIVGIAAFGVFLGIPYAAEASLGIPTYSLLGPVVVGAAGMSILLFVFAKAKQSTLRDIGLDAAGRAAKSRDIKDFDKKSGRGHWAVLRNRFINRKHFEWPSGFEPKSFEDNRLLTFVLQDYALRLDTFLAKWYTVKEIIRKKFVALNDELDRFGESEFKKASDLRREIQEYRSGTDSSSWAELYAWMDENGPIKGTQKTYSPEELKLLIESVRRGEASIDEITPAGNLRARVYELLKKRRQISGWTAFDREIIAAINDSIEKMIGAIQAVNDYDARIAAAKTEDEKEKISLEKEEKINDIINDVNILKSRIISARSSATHNYEEFVRRLKAYGVHHEVRSYLLNLCDTYNPSGSYKHYYIITKPGARFRTNPNLADYRHSEDAPEGIEVDPHGFYVDEKNERDVKGVSITPRKLLNPRAMSQFIPNFLEFRAYLQSAWFMFLHNFRTGKFAANSRTVSDYAEAFKDKIDVHSNDDAVKFSTRIKEATAIEEEALENSDVKFDRRALANPGKIPYKGLKAYNSGSAELDKEFPMLTQAGMIMFLELLVRAIEIDSEKVLRDFARFPEDTRKWPNSEQELIDAIINATGNLTKKDEDGNS